MTLVRDLAAGILFLVFITLFGKGFERLVYGGKLYGAAAMVFGWLAGLAAVWLVMSGFIGHPIRLFSENVSAAPGIDASATCYRRSENVGVSAIVVPKFKFRNIEWHVFGADLVESADHAALQGRPETLNRVGVDSADNILMLFVPNEAVRILFAEPRISAHVIGGEEADIKRERENF